MPHVSDYTSDQRKAAVTATLEAMHNGESVRSIARRLDVPEGALRLWVAADLDAEQYTRAREAQAHVHADEALEAAYGVDDYARAVEVVLEAEEQEANAEKNPAARAAKRAIVNALRQGAIQRDRLRVDTLKWRAAKFHPNRYGERQALEVTTPEPLTIRIVRE